MKEGSRGSKEQSHLLGIARFQGLAVRMGAGSSGRVGTGILWSTSGSGTPPLPMTWVQEQIRHDLSWPG